MGRTTARAPPRSPPPSHGCACSRWAGPMLVPTCWLLPSDTAPPTRWIGRMQPISASSRTLAAPPGVRRAWSRERRRRDGGPAIAGRLRDTGRAALSGRGPDQPCDWYQRGADADARGDGASAGALRRGADRAHRGARAHQLHDDGAHHGLWPAGPPAPRRLRPIVAGVAVVRGLADVAQPAGRGDRAPRPDIQPVVRASRVLAHRRHAQGRPRSAAPRAAGCLRLSGLRLRGTYRQ